MAPSGRFIGPDGAEYVSINIATHGVFARACLDELARQGGPRRHHMLRFAKAISVPVSVLDGARASLRRAGESSKIPEGEDE